LKKFRMRRQIEQQLALEARELQYRTLIRRYHWSPAGRRHGEIQYPIAFGPNTRVESLETSICTTQSGRMIAKLVWLA
jgi:hypothetical protein